MYRCFSFLYSFTPVAQLIALFVAVFLLLWWIKDLETQIQSHPEFFRVERSIQVPSNFLFFFYLTDSLRVCCLVSAHADVASLKGRKQSFFFLMFPKVLWPFVFFLKIGLMPFYALLNNWWRKDGRRRRLHRYCSTSTAQYSEVIIRINCPLIGGLFLYTYCWFI